MRHEPFEIVDRRTKAADESAEPQPPENEIDALVEPISLAEVDRIYSDPVPIFDRVLIRRNAKETTWGGTHFVIPESAQKSANRGVVVACADFYIIEGQSFPMVNVVKPGDVVTFSAFNTEDIDCDGEVFTLCSVFDLKLIEKVSFALGVSHAVGI
jgi:co-chaperonin GroES (HSP10)